MATTLTSAQSALLPSAVQFQALRRGTLSWADFIAPTEAALNPAPEPITVNSRRATPRLIQPPVIEGVRKMWHATQYGRFLVGTTTEKRGWVVRDTADNLDAHFGSEKDAASKPAAIASATALNAEFPADAATTEAVAARIASDKTAR